ncbi:MAG TPA: hypothetical protein RMH99_03660 [Sandaracinaceae bacterium LLY-WYZ-13_1]|nr:hypothetical protein [Sandaracinaceae bacterium LLY-WYZ-13_1]
MSDPNLNMGVGGGQPPFGPGPSLEEDEKALKKGRTGVLVAGILAAVAVTGGLMFVLMSGEGGDEYGAIGRQINGMKQEHFDAFWSCALPNEQLSNLRSDQDLRYAITKRAQTNPGRYAQHVREQCLVKLNEHEPRLQQLIAPEDLQGQLDDLSGALSDLRGGWNEYVEQLDQHEGAYEEGEYTAQLNKIAKGWYDYKHAHNQLNSTIREHLH